MEKQNVSAESAASGSGRSRALPILLLAVGLLAGGISGALVAGPLISKGAASVQGEARRGEPAQARGGATDALYADREEYEEEEDPKAPRAEYVIEDLVLNPAGSQGTRFLMATVAFQVKSAEAVEKMKARDAEIRDSVLGVLGSKTVEELAAPDSARTLLKEELRMSVGRLFPRGTVRRVYLPKFVIQ